jgi:GDP-D-mannose 3', 5'-epimerase
LVRHLSKCGHIIFAMKGPHNCKNIFNDNVTEIPTDLTNRNEIHQDIYYYKPDVVFALAANHGGIGYITALPYSVMKTNLQIDMNTIEACRAFNIKRLIYASSACVYPKSIAETGIPLAEHHVKPYDPDGEYGWAKLTTEKLLAVSDVNYAAARLHTVYGPGVRLDDTLREKVPIALCRKVAKADDCGTIKMWGDGRQMRTFCHVSDTVEALTKLMYSSYWGPINIGSEELITINQLLSYILLASGKMVHIEHEHDKPTGVQIRGTDISLAKHELDWAPKIKIKDGIKELYQWTLTHLKS